jgi:hypothetical protein
MFEAHAVIKFIYSYYKCEGIDWEMNFTSIFQHFFTYFVNTYLYILA